MSKKHYEQIAAVLRDQRERGGAAEKWRVDEIARALAAQFADENPRFDTGRFLAACK